MKNKILHTSELPMLAALLSMRDVQVIVYDPFSNLVSDEASDSIMVCSRLELLGLSAQGSHRPICVVNNSGEQLPMLNVDYIIEFNSGNRYDNKRRITCRIINNPGGTIRWLYPSNSRKPWFLAFYNFNYWKAALYKGIVRGIFKIGASRALRHGTIVLHTGAELNLEYLVGAERLSRGDYAIFSGTRGQNRKMVLATADQNRIDYFYKIALNQHSRQNLQNENRILGELASRKMSSATIPSVAQINPMTIRLSNIQPLHPDKEAAFGRHHALFLEDLYEGSQDTLPFSDLPLCSQTSEWLEEIGVHPRLRELPFAKELFLKLKDLHQELQTENPLVPVALAHGDFTRWNCYTEKERVYVYDWELAKPQMPMLHDLFHFVIQGAVYASNADYISILGILHGILETPELERIIQRFHIHPSRQLRLYLLQNASYYLHLYLDQQPLHQEAFWLFKTWSQLLPKGEEGRKNDSQRDYFIHSFFRFLEDKEYALLKSAGKSTGELSYTSDIDLLVSREGMAAIRQWVKSGVNIQKIKTVRKSYMTTLQLFFFDHSFLSIDLLNGFQRKDLRYIEADWLLAHAELHNGIKILPPAYDYLYIFLFYQINYASVPEKYAREFAGLDRKTEEDLLQVLASRAGVVAPQATDTFPFSKGQREAVYQFLYRQKYNGWIPRFFRRIRYNMDMITGFVMDRGVMLTFSGVDGAGKSTILNEVKEMLEKKYRKKVVVIRHRPSILPILSALKYGKEAAEQRCVDSLPRKGNNKSLLSSLLRFGYYYTDYLFGQCIVYLKYILRGYIVLYDRYYFDFIVDGKRSNIVINKNFIKGLYRLVYKPQLNVFLYAQPEVILKRKKELSAEDITQLTHSYQFLFRELGNSSRYLCIENIDKSETIQKIEQAFIHLN